MLFIDFGFTAGGLFSSLHFALQIAKPTELAQRSWARSRLRLRGLLLRFLFVLVYGLTALALLAALFLTLATLLGFALLALLSRFAEHDVFAALVEANDA